jgi:hypothetical protein
MFFYGICSPNLRVIDLPFQTLFLCLITFSKKNLLSNYIQHTEKESPFSFQLTFLFYKGQVTPQEIYEYRCNELRNGFLIIPVIDTEHQIPVSQPHIIDIKQEEVELNLFLINNK